MAKHKLSKTKLREAGWTCLLAMVDRLEEVGSLGIAARSLIAAGDYDRAFGIALDAEPLLRDADRVLQAAAMLRRIARQG